MAGQAAGRWLGGLDYGLERLLRHSCLFAAFAGTADGILCIRVMGLSAYLVNLDRALYPEILSRYSEGTS